MPFLLPVIAVTPAGELVLLPDFQLPAKPEPFPSALPTTITATPAAANNSMYEHETILEIARDLSAGGARAAYEYPPIRTKHCYCPTCYPVH